MNFLHEAVDIFSNLEYLGMFFGMFLSNSFIPFPSEVVMIPAGFLVGSGKLNFFLCVLSGTLGGICGSMFNYVLALKLGREVLIKWKIIKIAYINKSEKFFEKYGVLSVLFGSLMPVIRQYISVPAGVSRMKLYRFVICIGVGVGIWVSFLTLLGYFVGDNKLLILQALNNFNTILIFLAVVTIGAIGLFKLKKWRKCRTMKAQTQTEIKKLVKAEVEKEVESEVKELVKEEVEEEVKEEIKEEVKDLVKKEIKALTKAKPKSK